MRTTWAAISRADSLPFRPPQNRLWISEKTRRCSRDHHVTMMIEKKYNIYCLNFVAVVFGAPCALTCTGCGADFGTWCTRKSWRLVDFFLLINSNWMVVLVTRGGVCFMKVNNFSVYPSVKLYFRL